MARFRRPASRIRDAAGGKRDVAVGGWRGTTSDRPEPITKPVASNSPSVQRHKSIIAYALNRSSRPSAGAGTRLVIAIRDGGTRGNRKLIDLLVLPFGHVTDEKIFSSKASPFREKRLWSNLSAMIISEASLGLRRAENFQKLI